MNERDGEKSTKRIQETPKTIGKEFWEEQLKLADAELTEKEIQEIKDGSSEASWDSFLEEADAELAELVKSEFDDAERFDEDAKDGRANPNQNRGERREAAAATDADADTAESAAADSADSNDVATDELEIIPEDFLTENQIETLQNKYRKLGYTEEQINAKINEYAKKAKACKEAEAKGVENLPKTEKGNYGEMKADLDMLDKGYVRISEDGVTDLSKPLGRGIDGVYQNPDGKPQYIILEVKYGESQLNVTKDGKQGSDGWIDITRLNDAVGKEKANEIREAMVNDDVGVVEARINQDGHVTYTALDEDGKYSYDEDVFIND